MDVIAFVVVAGMEGTLPSVVAGLVDVPVIAVPTSVGYGVGAGEDLRVPWTARRSNQSIPKGNQPDCSLEGLIVKLRLQYFGHLMQKANSLEKTLMMGKIEGNRERGGRR